ncbi:putative [Helicobacter pylori J99]|uniref:Putative n=1 Tax=Helicobacter pylori (strain J99 / ATCC 700824) TaxID=85963 RepID=Q9ZKI9_HELPJ|nr:putative [Helicobacter pylori J99]
MPKTLWSQSLPTAIFHTDPSITDWSATYKTTTTQTTQPYLRPAQDNEKHPTTYNLITTQTTINRTQSVLKNELHLSNDYLKYVEIHQGYYKDNDLKQSQAILIGLITTSIKVKAFALNITFGVKAQRLVRIGIIGMIIKSLALKD